jgi:hypothetical protein
MAPELRRDFASRAELLAKLARSAIAYLADEFPEAQREQRGEGRERHQLAAEVWHHIHRAVRKPRMRDW